MAFLMDFLSSKLRLFSFLITKTYAGFLITLVRLISNILSQLTVLIVLVNNIIRIPISSITTIWNIQYNPTIKNITDVIPAKSNKYHPLLFS